MRIGLVTGEFPPMQGGVGAYTEQLARALAAAGHELHVITSHRARPLAAGERRRWGSWWEPADLGFARLHARARRWRWPDVALVTDLALRYELEVVNVQYQAAAYNMRSPAVNLLPWRLRGITRTVVTYHDLRVPYLFPKAGRLRTALVRWMGRQADGVIATNPEDFQTLGEWGIERPRRREIPIGSNIRPRRPSPGVVTAARQALGLEPDDVLLGYFGFLNESKGADVLLSALARLEPRYHLVFIGGRAGASDATNNEAFVARLETQGHELGVTGRVHWTDLVPEEEVSTYLHAADLMVMPYRDGASLRRGTLMAVLAHERPLLSTTPAAPTAALVHGENVWLTPGGDADSLAESIRDLAADATVRERLGQGAGRLAREFSWESIGQRTAAFYAELPPR